MTEPGPTPERIAEMRADLEFARDSHLGWAEHLEAHAASGEGCPECDAKPYKLNAQDEREWVAKYDSLIAALDAFDASLAREAALAAQVTALEQELDTAKGMLAAAWTRSDRVDAERDAIAAQARDISVMLSDAGMNAQPIPSAVRSLISNRDTLAATLARVREHIADCFHCQQRGVCEEVEAALAALRVGD